MGLWCEVRARLLQAVLRTRLRREQRLLGPSHHHSGPSGLTTSSTVDFCGCQLGRRHSWAGEANKYIQAALFQRAKSQGRHLACLKPEFIRIHQNLDEVPRELLKLNGAICLGSRGHCESIPPARPQSCPFLAWEAAEGRGTPSDHGDPCEGGTHLQACRFSRVLYFLKIGSEVAYPDLPFPVLMKHFQFQFLVYAFNCICCLLGQGSKWKGQARVSLYPSGGSFNNARRCVENRRL